MDRTVPGHAMAATLPIACLIGLTFALAWFLGWPVRWWLMWELVVFLIGVFIIDQSTHLQQEAHKDPPPTALERFLQDHRVYSWIIGGILIIGSVLHAACF